MNMLAFGLFAGGTMMAGRTWRLLSRGIGGALVGTAIFFAASPAFADQTLVAADNSEVACTVSAKDLTRISLKDDRFASISKLTTGVDTDDFTVVNEPTRGDIYISVPDGYTRSTVSFFGTSAKGFVYKFACRAVGAEAVQIFVTNKAILGEAPVEQARRASPADTSIALVQAMYSLSPLEGFELRNLTLDPVSVGTLRVQMVAEYRGLDLSGRVLRIENRGKSEVTLDETVIAPSNAVAVSVAQPALKPGTETTAYIVLPTGAVQ